GLAVLVVRAAPQVRDFSFVAVDLRTGGGGLRLAAGGLVRHLELLLRFGELFPRALLAGNALRWRRRLRDGDLRGLDGLAFWRRGLEAPAWPARAVACHLRWLPVSMPHLVAAASQATIWKKIAPSSCGGNSALYPPHPPVSSRTMSVS